VSGSKDVTVRVKVRKSPMRKISVLAGLMILAGLFVCGPAIGNDTVKWSAPMEHYPNPWTPTTAPPVYNPYGYDAYGYGAYGYGGYYQQGQQGYQRGGYSGNPYYGYYGQ
jgi:hypothetical protein